MVNDQNVSQTLCYTKCLADFAPEIVIHFFSKAPLARLPDSEPQTSTVGLGPFATAKLFIAQVNCGDGSAVDETRLCPSCQLPSNRTLSAHSYWSSKGNMYAYPGVV